MSTPEKKVYRLFENCDFSKNQIKYIGHYKKLICKAFSRNIDFYTERHHITPKCLGGSDDDYNLIRLTPEEHFVAHQLLVKIFPNHHGLAHAAFMMTWGGKSLQRQNNKVYRWVRRKHAEALSKSMTGKVASEETKLKLSISHKGKKHTEKQRNALKDKQKGELNGFYGKAHSEDAKKKCQLPLKIESLFLKKLIKNTLKI